MDDNRLGELYQANTVVLLVGILKWAIFKTGRGEGVEEEYLKII